MKTNFTLNLRNQLSKFKYLSLLAGTISLATSVAIIPVVLAQSNTPPAPTQQPPNWLNLTSEQQAKMQQIRQAEQQQMDNILTAEQKARLDTARQNREDPHRVLESLNLTDDQKAKIQELHRTSKEQMDAILTAEQRQQMQQHPPGFHANRLNLTSEQQAKMEQIRQAEQQQMDNILTAEQKARLETARQNREDPRQVFESLNLTDDQKAKIEEIRRASKDKMDAILTDEQRQQMQQHPPAPPEGLQPPQ